jgi:hydrogenase-4 component F
MVYVFVLCPLLFAAVAWGIKNRFRPLVLLLAAVTHLGMTLYSVLAPQSPTDNGWLWLDPLGRIVLLCISLLFAICAFYAVGYLRYYNRRSNRFLCVCMLICLSAMTLVSMAQHLGLFWVAMETTTLTMAPLIYFNRNARSIEATWKYIMICSVGIALAFLGLMFLAYSTHVAHKDATLVLGRLIESAGDLNKAWLHAAFVFLLVGYGTKMGLAPLHAWKPDTYGEAPGIVGALLAGGLVNCSFLALIRVYQVCLAAGPDVVFFQRTLIGMGLISMAVAGIFIARQSDFKRLLAYSSVEHVGILAIGLGLGKGATFAALFHVINNGLTKGVLFLSAGNIHRSYSSKSVHEVRGALRRLPWSAGLFLAGFIAITGSPPFSPFISEFGIVAGAFEQGQTAVGVLFLVFLAVIFIGLANTVLPVVLGDPPQDIPDAKYRDRVLTVAPLCLVMLIILVLGIWQPAFLIRLLEDGAAMLEVRP